MGGMLVSAVSTVAATDHKVMSTGHQLLLMYGISFVTVAVGAYRSRASALRWLYAPLLALAAFLPFWIVGIVAGYFLPEWAANTVGTIAGLAAAYRMGAFPTRPDQWLVRGARLVDAREIKNVTVTAGLTLAGIPIPPADETKHFKMIGTTGTGKSTAIRELLAGALKRGNRAVIADPDGGYAKYFFDAARGDVRLNPFEPGSAAWAPFAEIRAPYDVEHLARALIPDSPGEERAWRDYARTFLTAAIRRLREEGQGSLSALTRLILVAPVEELEVLLAGTPAQPLLAPDNARMFGSVRAVAASAVQALTYARAPAEETFSVRRWVREGQGVLFLPYSAGQVEALKSLIAAWMRLAIVETMDLGEGDARLWFVLDELDALGAIDGLKDALARLRKFGGRCVLGFQSIAQVSALYGRGDAQTLVENCGNTLILRCSGSEGGGTAQFASRLIGEREVVRRQESETGEYGGWAPKTATTSYHHVTESAVLASQIEQLPDLQGYWKSASTPSWQRVQLKR